MDDFSLAGTGEFLKMVLDGVSEKMTVSKVERDKFRFTGLDVHGMKEGIEISMDDYVDSLEDVKDIFGRQIEMRIFLKKS